ncbi:hypothetical protein [Celeribacter sp.]|uniref:hypothetical protein n=1 Tax=Celeribacter sp. TaxID=1890673 RepID=UPI003A906274
MAMNPLLKELVRKSADKYGTAADRIAEIKAELATEMDMSWDAEKEGRIYALFEEQALMVSDFFEAARKIERLERGQQRLRNHIIQVEVGLRELGVTGEGAGFLSCSDDVAEEEAA